VQKANSASGGLRPLDPLPWLIPLALHYRRLPSPEPPDWPVSSPESPDWPVFILDLSGKSSPPKKKNSEIPQKFDETEEPESRIHDWVTLTKILVPICWNCLNHTICTKLGQLHLRKIIKIVATIFYCKSTTTRAMLQLEASRFCNSPIPGLSDVGACSLGPRDYEIELAVEYRMSNI